MSAPLQCVRQHLSTGVRHCARPGRNQLPSLELTCAAHESTVQPVEVETAHANGPAAAATQMLAATRRTGISHNLFEPLFNRLNRSRAKDSSHGAQRTAWSGGTVHDVVARADTAVAEVDSFMDEILQMLSLPQAKEPVQEAA